MREVRARVRVAVGLSTIMVGCASARLEVVDTATLEERLRSALDRAPGVVFGAVSLGGEPLVRAAGHADLAAGRLLSEDTPLSWFSVTKLFTATAVLQLAEGGQVDLDAPVHRYLPELHVSRNGRHATVRQLLSHSAGLRNPIPIAWIHLDTEAGPGLDELVRRHVGSAPELDFEPGERSAYSNLGYLLLGQIIERVSGERYEEYVARRVLEPLGCTGAGFRAQPGAAVGYQRRWSLSGMAARWMLDGRFFGPRTGAYWELRPFSVDGAPYGGLRGPVRDLLRFAQMILAEGRAPGGRILREDSVRVMLAPARARDGSPLATGLGWRLGSEDGRELVHHLGGGGGYRAELRIYPSMGYAVAVLANETSFPTEPLARLVVR